MVYGAPRFGTDRGGKREHEGHENPEAPTQSARYLDVEGKHTPTTRTVDRITRVIEARRQRPRRAKRAAAKA